MINSKNEPDARLNVRKEIERLAHELSNKKGNVNSSELDNWLEAERIVAEWQKDHAKKDDAPKKKTGPLR